VPENRKQFQKKEAQESCTAEVESKAQEIRVAAE
jgi:hypothetical protein